MSITSELNYDVAKAVLERKKENDPAATKELLDALMNFHVALRPLVKQSRRRRWLTKEETAGIASKVGN